MLENKLIKASQAILKNTTLIVSSGSGITADCVLDGGLSPSWEGDKVPVFRGTFGLWKQYPALRKKLLLFEELVEENFFRDNPHAFWFVYGDLWNKLNRAIPHKGYTALREIIETADKKDKHWIYHSGVDNLYERSEFDM
jgi:NAD-dependent SIR2 family protein deacetylase